MKIIENIDSPPNNQSDTPKRQPIYIENIIELKRKNLSHDQIAKVLGCSKTNVTLRLAKYKNELATLDNFKNHRADVLAINQMRLLHSITEAEIKRAPLGTKILATCQLYDKERLERGQSTENVSVKGVSANIAREVSKITQAIAELDRDDT